MEELTNEKSRLNTEGGGECQDTLGKEAVDDAPVNRIIFNLDGDKGGYIMVSDNKGSVNEGKIGSYEGSTNDGNDGANETDKEKELHVGGCNLCLAKISNCGREGGWGKRRTLKNVFILSFTFFLNFMAYDGLSILQSSLHLQKGMGVITQATMFGCTAMSSLLLPKLVMKWLGHKKCICLGLITYLLWMAANGYAVWGTMLPTSIVVGISGGIIFTTASSYITILARHYASITGQDSVSVTAMFFGIYLGFFKINSVFGSIISSTILARRSLDNTTQPEVSELSHLCGLNDCPATASNNTNFTKPSSSAVWTLVGVYMSLGITALVICCLFLDPVPTDWVTTNERKKSVNKTARQEVLSSLTATIRQLFRLKQVLLVPFTLYIGMQIAFVDADYTKSFVACFLGIPMVGWSVVAKSVLKATAIICVGRITKFTGIQPMLLYATCVTLIYKLSLCFWSPSTGQEYLFFIFPCISALAESVWMVETHTIYGQLLFPEDSAVAFSSYRFLNSCGKIIAFSYSSFLCTSVKLYIILSVFVVGMSLLFLVLRAPYFNSNRLDNNNKSQTIEIGTVDNVNVGNADSLIVSNGDNVNVGLYGIVDNHGKSVIIGDGDSSNKCR